MIKSKLLVSPLIISRLILPYRIPYVAPFKEFRRAQAQSFGSFLHDAANSAGLAVRQKTLRLRIVYPRVLSVGLGYCIHPVKTYE